MDLKVVLDGNPVRNAMKNLTKADSAIIGRWFMEYDERRQLQLRLCVMASLDRLPRYRVRLHPNEETLITIDKQGK